MRLMHYIFGMPPLRGGGTIKYAMDLAAGQIELGYDVAIIYPGEIRKNHTKVKIIVNKDIGKIKVYEIINPLPVPLVTGIKEPSRFMEGTDKEVYREFLEKAEIDILHIHSLMGLHKEFLEVAREKGIKLIFTTHDYFGICPKTNLLYNGKICNDCDWMNCRICCANAEDVSILMRRQSHWFQYLIKYKQLVKVKHMLCKDAVHSQDEGRRIVNDTDNNIVETHTDSYEKLRNYYLEELNMIDVMHYNSTVAKEQYEKRITPRKAVLLRGMHREIYDERKIRSCKRKIRFSYLGYAVDYKGYDLLLDVLDELEKSYASRFVLNTYIGDSVKKRQYIRQHEPYAYDELGRVFDDMDVLIVPSLWAETYGLVVLEAFSFGIPVIVTNNVGASDLVRQYEGTGIIVEPTYESLKMALEDVLVKKERINQMNRAICEAKIDFGYEKYIKTIISEVYLG